MINQQIIYVIMLIIKFYKKNKNTIFIHIPELKNIKDLDKLINLISNINITINI